MPKMTKAQFDYIMHHRLNPAVGRIRMDDHEGRSLQPHLDRALDKAYDDLMEFLDGNGPEENGKPTA